MEKFKIDLTNSNLCNQGLPGVRVRKHIICMSEDEIGVLSPISPCDYRLFYSILFYCITLYIRQCKTELENKQISLELKDLRNDMLVSFIGFLLFAVHSLNLILEKAAT